VPEPHEQLDEPKPTGHLHDRAKMRAYADLLLLRLFSASPGLAAYMIDLGVVDDNHVEVSFWKLPDEVTLSVTKLTGVDDTKVFSYYMRGRPCTGFKVFPDEKDLAQFDIEAGKDDHVASRDTDHPAVDRPETEPVATETGP
jgi:hypothetical protein